MRRRTLDRNSSSNCSRLRQPVNKLEPIGWIARWRFFAFWGTTWTLSLQGALDSSFGCLASVTHHRRAFSEPNRAYCIPTVPP